MKKLNLTLLAILIVSLASAVPLPVPSEVYVQNPELADNPNPIWAIVIGWTIVLSIFGTIKLIFKKMA